MPTRGETKVVVLIGEKPAEGGAGGAYIKANMKKPYRADAGKNAPRGRSMGHAGAIVAADGTGSAQSK